MQRAPVGLNSIKFILKGVFAYDLRWNRYCQRQTRLHHC